MPLLTWKQHAHRAMDSFRRGDYQYALTCYQLALETAPSAEHQVLLSNIVGCRIRIGNMTKQEVKLAINEAKECIALNPQWSKGHVRLASAYILAKEFNNACDSLKRAIQLDPQNQMARQMLLMQQQQPNASPAGRSFFSQWYDKLFFFRWLRRLKTWYQSRPQHVKTMIKEAVIFGIILVMLFVGRYLYLKNRRLLVVFYDTQGQVLETQFYHGEEANKISNANLLIKEGRVYRIQG